MNESSRQYDIVKLEENFGQDDKSFDFSYEPVIIQ